MWESLYAYTVGDDFMKENVGWGKSSGSTTRRKRRCIKCKKDDDNVKVYFYIKYQVENYCVLFSHLVTIIIFPWKETQTSI